VASLLNKQMVIRAIVMGDYEKYIKRRLAQVLSIAEARANQSKSKKSLKSSRSKISHLNPRVPPESTSHIYHPDFPPLPCLEYFFPPSIYMPGVDDDSISSLHPGVGRGIVRLYPPFLPMMVPSVDVITQIKIAILAVYSLSFFFFFYVAVVRCLSVWLW
jgi:hypothetical protein